jgi:Fungal protein kinase
MELWVFDRSGPYSSDEPEQFVRALAGYALMSDEELGLDSFVERNGEGHFVTVTEDATGKETKIPLQPEPTFKQRAIISRWGRVCEVLVHLTLSPIEITQVVDCIKG